MESLEEEELMFGGFKDREDVSEEHDAIPVGSFKGREERKRVV
jgi:hypothetical protein